MIGWIDFSSEHRQKVRTVIDLLKKPGVVDELGIGVIRDAFADRMFPGISTIQTRAKYFTLLAAIVEDYVRRNEQRPMKETLEEYLRYWEQDFRINIARRYGDAGDGLGVIGISFGESRKKDVERRASSVYWNGLRTFGLIGSPLSLAEFSRVHSGRPKLQSLLQATGRNKGDDPDADDLGRPRIRAPQVDEDYWENPDIELTQDEATFLKQQIISNAKGSLLAKVLLDDNATNQLIELRSQTLFADFSELPFLQQPEFAELATVARHANWFWMILHGAHIRYNVLIDSLRADDGAAYVEQWEDWRDRMEEFDWGQWNSRLLWDIVEQYGGRVKNATREFVNDWIAQAQAGATDIEECDRLIARQEVNNKQRKARLRRNPRDEQVEGWIGLSRLDYRLPQVQRIVQDIRDGETGGARTDA